MPDARGVQKCVHDSQNEANSRGCLPCPTAYIGTPRVSFGCNQAAFLFRIYNNRRLMSGAFFLHPPFKILQKNICILRKFCNLKYCKIAKKLI